MGLFPIDLDILPTTDDRIFKAILTSPQAKPFLMKLVSRIIGRRIIDVTVHNNELPISDTQEKAEHFDVNTTIDDGSQVNLEMQARHMKEDPGVNHNNLKGRSIYYLCDLHSSQPAIGQQRYDRLVRTYQVTFCSYTVFPNRKEYMNTFSMRHDVDNELLHDAIQVVIIELSKLEDIVKKPVETMTDMEKFSIFFEYAEDPAYREIVNKVIESEEVLIVAGNVLMNISQDERERAIYLSRKKYQMDMESNLATARDNGRAEGRLEGSLAIARNLLSLDIPIDKIITATGLTREEVENLK
jgi:predicted transposase/invertase (TIGR01784 family)